MLTRSVIRLGALCGILAGAALLAGPASAAYLINPGLVWSRRQSRSRRLGSLRGGASAALGWSQFMVVPGGALTTTLTVDHRSVLAAAK